MIFFVMGHRIQAYIMPDWESAEGSLKSPGGQELTDDERKAILEKTSALPPFLKWSFEARGTNFEQPVLITSDQISAVSANGDILSFNKFERAAPYEFQTNGNVAAPMGQHGVMAYLGSEDYTLYAFNMSGQRLAWRFLATLLSASSPK